MYLIKIFFMSGTGNKCYRKASASQMFNYSG